MPRQMPRKGLPALMTWSMGSTSPRSSNWAMPSPKAPTPGQHHAVGRLDASWGRR